MTNETEPCYECPICGNFSSLKSVILECQRRHGRDVYILESNYDHFEIFPHTIWLTSDEPNENGDTVAKKYVLASDEEGVLE